MADSRKLDGLRKSASNRALQTRLRAEEAIATLACAGEPVNFQSVATNASVSPAWLYKDPEIRHKIMSLRADAGGSVRRRKAAPNPPTLSSKDSIIATLRQRVKELETEKRELSHQVEVLYGMVYGRRN